MHADVGKNAGCKQRYGSVNFDENYMVTSFSEKNPEKKSGWINAGIYCMRRELMAALPGNSNISLEKDLFPTLIGNDFFAFPQGTKFIDIGTPNSYKEAETFFMKNGRERLAQTVEEAPKEYARGEVRRGEVDDLMFQITQ